MLFLFSEANGKDETAFLQKIVTRQQVGKLAERELRRFGDLLAPRQAGRHLAMRLNFPWPDFAPGVGKSKLQLTSDAHQIAGPRCFGDERNIVDPPGALTSAYKPIKVPRDTVLVIHVRINAAQSERA